MRRRENISYSVSHYVSPHKKKREKRILSNRCSVLSRIAKVQCPEIKRVAIYCRKIENQVLVVGKWKVYTDFRYRSEIINGTRPCEINTFDCQRIETDSESIQ